MKLKLLKPIDFRTDKFKEGDLVEIPEGLAQKLILDGIAIKALKEEPKAEAEEPKKTTRKKSK